MDKNHYKASKLTKNATDNINLGNTKEKIGLNDENDNQDSFNKEEKFLSTKSIINKNTEINISKIFFPDKLKKKLIQNSPKTINDDSYKEDSKKNLFSYNNSDKPLQKIKLLPLNHKSIFEKKSYIKIKNNFTISLNNELLRKSSIYGNEDFSRSKLKPIGLQNNTHNMKLSDSFFRIEELDADHVDINEEI